MLFFFCWFWFSLPKQLFNDPCSGVIVDKNGVLLNAMLADDKQWRFPYSDNLPEKFETSIIQFEDRHFYHHPGFNPFSLGRALFQNIQKGKIFSGGSTISMQVIRLSRKNHRRTFLEKFIEIMLALRMELTYSKHEILSLYASHAPFGSNVVGLDAASWRYFGRSPDKLSWAEISSIAVLPNSPSLIYPGKNHKRFKEKRDRLLKRLWQKKLINKNTYLISLNEPLPGKPFPLPQTAPHLMMRIYHDGYKGQLVRTTILSGLQLEIQEIIKKHQRLFKANDINNAAALVIDIKTGNVMAYIGNTDDSNPEHCPYVDVINSPRSTGSILKPLLYAAMLNDGHILPTTLIPDIPTQINGYSPENFNQTFDGAVPAKRALARSLNVPAVKMLQNYGIEPFNYYLKSIGITTLKKPASHYGLSIILGGAEATLWDIASVYARMAKTLTNFPNNSLVKNQTDIIPPHYIMDVDSKYEHKFPVKTNSDKKIKLSASAIWLTFEAMIEVARPENEFFWQQFSSSSRIAWKTGTSFGFRDGWAIGVNPQYVVAVWIGNADGEGKPDLTGINTAAPVMFDIFKLLKPHGWFNCPFDDLIKIPVCRQSGFKASTICEQVDTILSIENGIRTAVCPYHRTVHLDPTEKWQVTGDCEQVDKIIHRSWFVLPPVMEWYFKSKNPFYKTLPPYRPDCRNIQTDIHSMDIIYPRENSKLFIPVELNAEKGKIIFKVAHRISGITIYWHLDEKYIGSTNAFHQMALAPPTGFHTLTLVDQNGETITRRFEIMAK